jgi:hypothetical protein
VWFERRCHLQEFGRFWRLLKDFWAPFGSVCHLAGKIQLLGKPDSSKAVRGTEEEMSLRQKTVRVETHSVTVVRTNERPIDLWCEACRTTTAMVTPERAAEMLETNPRAIYQQVERGNVHFVEAGAGELLICCESLGGETRVKALNSKEPRC